jgi:hypothetical protein
MLADTGSGRVKGPSPGAIPTYTLRRLDPHTKCFLRVGEVGEAVIGSSR